MSKRDDYTQEELDHRANQLNPNNDEFWESRGYDERPEDWESIVKNESSDDSSN